MVERILALIKQKGLSVSAVEKQLGFGNGAIKRFSTNSPSIDKIIAISNFLNVSVEYVLFGKETQDSLPEDVVQLIEYYNQLGDKEKGIVLGKAETFFEIMTERAAEQEKVQYKKTANKKEPLRFPDKTEQDEEECCYIDICALPAGAGTGVYLDESRTEPLKIVHTNIADRANYAIRVSGDSMEPKFHDGDIVLVETCPSINIGEIGIFIVNGEGFIKQYDGNTLISLNPKRKNIHLQEDDAVFCRGRVLGIAEAAK